MTKRPEFSRLPVAVEISSAQLGQAPAVIDLSAGDAGGIDMRERHDGRRDEGGAGADSRAHVGTGPFSERPAVVASTMDAIDHLILFPPHVAYPQIPCLPIEAHPKWIAESIGPDLRPGVGQLDE